MDAHQDLESLLTSQNFLALWNTKLGKQDQLRWQKSAESLPEMGVPGGRAFLSSGSSGEPVWWCHSLETLSRAADATNPPLGVSEKSVWGLVLPVFHVGGFQVLNRAHRAGARWVDARSTLSASETFSVFLNEKVTHVSVVPTQLWDWVQSGESLPRCLECVLVGGDRVDASLAQKVRSLGWPVVLGYGSTETGGAFALGSVSSSVEHNPNYALLPHLKYSFVESQGLWVSGSSIALANSVGEASTASTLQWSKTSQRVLLSDDVQLTFHDGFPKTLQYLGRISETVKVLGEKVSLQKLNALCAQVLHELANCSAENGLHSSALVVVAVPHPRLGQQLVLVAENSTLSDGQLNAVLAEVNSRVAPYEKLSQALVLRESFPRSALGKIQVRKLADLIANHLEL